MGGPLSQTYKNYMTLDANSSILSLPLCHFGHTSAFALLFNTGVLWTIGNSHAKMYGCMRFVKVFGAGCAVATLLAAKEVYSNGGPQLAGSIGGTSALITYNVFKNPHWFNAIKYVPLPFLLLAAMSMYGAHEKDFGIIGGVTGGFAAMLLAL